jgi:cytochrome c556
MLATAAGLLLAGLGAHTLRAADDDKVPSIEDIMQKVNKRKSGLHSEVGDALKMGTVDWDKIKEKTKQYAALTDFMGKNDPPKGSKQSWEKLTKQYADDAKALDTAVGNKDKAAATKAWGKLDKECMGCHRPHRPMK